MKVILKGSVFCMNKGISFYWGYEISHEERAKILNTIGFDCVITNADSKFNKQNGKISKQIKLFKQYNLNLSSLHMRYNAQDLPYFWTKSRKGNWMERRLIKDVKIASKYGFPYVVVHIKGIPAPIGLKRIERILKICDKYNIDLAIENTENLACFNYVFDNIKHKHLKFCYDSGHANCFHPEIDFFKLLGDKLVCLHLHDNMGVNDDHTLNKYGTIDWDNLAKQLAQINFNGNLDYETLMVTRGNETALEVATEVYNQACEFEQLIKKYKNNKTKNKKEQ